jgi:hypothetical protein
MRQIADTGLIGAAMFGQEASMFCSPSTAEHNPGNGEPDTYHSSRVNAAGSFIWASEVNKKNLADSTS